MPPQNARKRALDWRKSRWAGCRRIVRAGGVAVAIGKNNLLDDGAECGRGRTANDLLSNVQDQGGTRLARYLVPIGRVQPTKLRLVDQDCQGCLHVARVDRLGEQALPSRKVNRQL